MSFLSIFSISVSVCVSVGAKERIVFLLVFLSVLTAFNLV